MKYKNILLFGLVFILLSSFISAIDVNDLRVGLSSYWNFSNGNGLNDTISTNHFTAVGNAIKTSSNCAVGSCITLDGVGDYLTRSSSTFDLRSGNFTVNFWAYNRGLLAQVSGFTQGGANNYNELTIAESYIAADKTVYVVGSVNGASWGLLSQTTHPTFGTGNNMITVTRRGNVYSTYVNATWKKNVTVAGNLVFTDTRMRLGCAYNAIINCINGTVDELAIWDGKGLSQQEITKLFELKGNLYNESFINFTISAKSRYDNSNINSFSISVQNQTTNKNYYCINNCSKILPKDKRKYNITFYNWSGWNITYTNWNFSDSGNLIGNLTSTDITFNIRFHDTNHLVNFSTINITDLNRTKIFNTTTGILHFYPLATNIKFNFKDDTLAFLTKNQSFIFTARQNETINITVNDTENKIRFLDAVDSTGINNATITITYPDSSTVIKTTNNTGWINVSSNYNGDFQFGTYYLTFNKLGYSSITVPLSILSTNIPRTVSFNISRVYIKVNIYNRLNGILLNKTTNLNFITLFNGSTSTGMYNKSNVSLIPNNYTVQALSSGFGTEIKTFSYTAQANVTINFYLLNLTQTNAGTFFINNYKNIVGFVLSGAKDILMEYDPLLLSYKQVSECYSNTNGECGFNIELGTKTYYVRATKTINNNLYTAQTLTSGEIILTDNEIRNLVLTFSDEFTVLPEDDLVYSITESFISNTSTITVDFYSISGLPKEVCVQYFSTTYGTSTSEYKSCLNSTSALQTIPAIRLLNRTKTYRAEVYIKGSLGNTNLETFNYPSISSSIVDTFDVWIINGFVLFIFICLLALSLYMKNITLFSVTTIIFSWLQVLIFPNYSLISVATFITIISILLIITQKKPNEE